MAQKKVKLEVTNLELMSLLDIIYTVEGMFGCSEPDENGENDWDTEMRKKIKQFDKMFKRNGFKR